MFQFYKLVPLFLAMSMLISDPTFAMQNNRKRNSSAMGLNFIGFIPGLARTVVNVFENWFGRKKIETSSQTVDTADFFYVRPPNAELHEEERRRIEMLLMIERRNREVIMKLPKPLMQRIIFQAGSPGTQSLLRITNFSSSRQSFHELWTRYTNLRGRLDAIFPSVGAISYVLENNALPHHYSSILISSQDAQLSYNQLEALIGEYMESALALVRIFDQHLGQVQEFLRENQEIAQLLKLDPKDIPGLITSQARIDRSGLTPKFSALNPLFFVLPIVYRGIFNLSEGSRQTLPELLGREVNENDLQRINELRTERNLQPLENLDVFSRARTMLQQEKWKDKFFQEGTMQWNMRMQYNHFRDMIKELVGGDLKILDNYDCRHHNWILKRHEDDKDDGENGHGFVRFPDGTPT